MIEKDPQQSFKLRPRPHRTKGRGFRISIAERLRVARHIPQAVVKVTSFSHGLHQVSSHLNYISRKGALPLEKNTGEILRGREAQEELAEDWSMDFDSRKRSRDTANLVFSMPRGSDLDALRGAVRKVGQRAFKDHDWVFAIHEEKNHPHAHMIVPMRGRDTGQKLRLRKADLFHLRELFAEAAREEGVPLAASPRFARGIGQKGNRQVLHHLKEKGITPRVEREAVREAIQLVRNRKGGVLPWEKAMDEHHQAEKELNSRYAERLRLEATHQPEAERMRLLQASEDLQRLAQTLPTPKTKRQELIRQVSEKLPANPKMRTPESGTGREIEK